MGCACKKVRGVDDASPKLVCMGESSGIAAGDTRKVARYGRAVSFPAVDVEGCKTPALVGLMYPERGGWIGKRRHRSDSAHGATHPPF